jgi:hypothetical protein
MKTKTQRANYQLPPNVKVGIFPMGEGKIFRWEIKQWNKKLGEGGPCKDRQAAVKEAWAKLAAVLQPKAEANATKAYLRQKLMYWTKSRPYVVMHVVEAMVHSVSRGECVRDARIEEHRRWKMQEGVVGRPRLPTHGKAKLSGEVAAAVFDLMTQLGLRGKAAHRWASRVMGRAYSDPENERHYDMADAETPEDQQLLEEFDDDHNPLTKDTPV